MKKIALLLYSLAVFVALPGTNVMAHDKDLLNVNESCGYQVIEDTNCAYCHDGSKDLTVNQITYLNDGACAFCPEVDSCNSAPPTEAELYDIARDTTKDYFEALFAKFIEHMVIASQDLPGGMTDPNIFAKVFPDCPDIAPIIASEFSRDTGYLVRRVTTRTRNSRNIPDDWELEQLKKFETMAANGDPRTLLKITKPDGNILPTREFEAFDVVKEGVGNDSEFYFRYMRSITMPPMPGADVPNNPNLPCLKCHGSQDDLAPGVLDATRADYPFDLAMGYKAGDIRAAWTIKIPLASRP